MMEKHIVNDLLSFSTYLIFKNGGEPQSLSMQAATQYIIERRVVDVLPIN